MSTAPTACVPQYPRQPGAATLVLRLLGDLDHGSLSMTLPNGERLHLGRGAPSASLSVRDWSMFDAALAQGDIGLGESYMAGAWDSDDLTCLLTLLAHNRQTLNRALYGNAWSLLKHRLIHMLRANTRTGSRRNIRAHYDLGNDFYALWLDATMTYSSALFAGNADCSLEDAQQAKYRRILDHLQAQPGQRILEIGCGWGGLAEVAALEYGCNVHGVTLSPAQLDYARRRAQARGFADRASFSLQDYRDVDGSYDHIASIEMFEAVGERFWPRYLHRLRELLKPGGKAMLQTITIADELFARYRRGTDFIQRYIFPGGMLASPAAFCSKARECGMAVRDAFAFGADYARTLQLWHQRLVARRDALRALGFDDNFERMWRFYLAYCAAGFASGSTDVYQFELTTEAR